MRAVVAGALLVGSLVAAGAVVAWNDLRLRREAAQQHLGSVAEGSAREIALMLGNLQRAFQGVGTDFAAIEHEAPSAAAPLRTQAMAGVLRRHWMLLDLSLRESAPPGEIAGRAGTLVVGMPQRVADGTLALPLLMQLPAGPDGRQRWLSGHLRADALQAAVSGRELGAHGGAIVFHADGTAITGIGDGPHAVDAVGVARRDPRSTRATEAGRLLDVDSHMVSRHAVAGYPLRVVVGGEHSHMLSGWHMFVAVLAVGCTMLLGVWLFGLRMLGRGARREVDMLRSIERSEHAIDDLRVRVRDAEAQYRFLYERFPLPACVYDRDTLDILEVNQAAIEQYGYSREEFLALRSPALLAEGSEDDVRAAIAHGVGPKPEHIWKHQRRDGSLMHVTVFASDVVFLDRPARLALALDVTDRVQAEAERERTEARFQMVTRATSDAVWDWDIERGSLWWNEGFRAHYGWDWQAEAATIEQWAGLVHPEDRALARDSLYAAVASGAADWQASYRLRRADGSYADVEDRGMILRESSGRAIRAVGGMLDVTRQRRDEADLRLLRRAMESTENGIVIVNAELDDQPLV
ncbi:MAG TPA: PAS domain S-box protein, partial [Luteimonas sp.]|nr:PAS domain S-box protein [Luteimonas sp.]